VEGNVQELEITWKRVIRIAWLLLWRGAVGGAVIGAVIGGVVGFIIGFIDALMGVPRDVSLSIIRISGAIVGSLVGLVWTCVVVRMALRKQFSDFRLALVPPQ
jgi:hypothetical protein